MPGPATKRARHDDPSSSDSEPEVTLRLALSQPNAETLKCTLPPLCNSSPSVFTSIAAFEAHYSARHSFVCSECRATLPDAKWLALHLEECHDPLWHVRKTRGDAVFRCFEDHCSLLFQTSSQRKKHVVKGHGYPRDFRYNLPYKGLPPNATSLLHDDKKSRARGQAKKEKEKDLVMQETNEPRTGPVTRSQRRAQARLEREEGEQAENKGRRTSPKERHAEAVRALFRGLEDPDTLEPEHINQEDTEMGALTSVMDRANLVPTRIHFGHSR